MLKRLIILAGLLLFAAPAFATTYTATTCDDTGTDHVQDKLDALIAAGAGNTLQIPAGTCHWATGISGTLPANTTILCAGSLSTVGGGDATVILDEITSTTPIMNIGLSSSDTQMLPTRIAGCTFQGTATGNPAKFGPITFGGSSHYVRLDHNHFTTGTYASGCSMFIAFFGDIYGVLDHNIHYAADLCNSIIGYGTSTGDENGDIPWSQATEFGTYKFLYVEDSVFGNNVGGGGTADDCTHGFKLVGRFNDMTNGGTVAVSWQTHPTQGIRARGCRAMEIYANNLAGTNTSPNQNAYYLSSGTAMVWGNPAPAGWKHFFTMHSYLRNDGTYAQGQPPNAWGYCGPTSPQSGTVTVTGGTTVTKTAGSDFSTSWTIIGTDQPMIFIAGTGYRIASVTSTTVLTLASNATNGVGQAYALGSYANGNTDANSGAPCLDQPGNGQGDLISGKRAIDGGSGATLVHNAATGKFSDESGFWPRQASEPIYEWMNTPWDCSSGSCGGQVAFNSVYEPSVLVSNVNYYTHAGADNVTGVQTSSSSPFAGTTGTGWGTHANRPATCTTGVSYFETDTGANWNDGSNPNYVGDGHLFICTATNTWTDSYTPYTYPHPLVNAGAVTATSGGNMRMHR